MLETLANVLSFQNFLFMNIGIAIGIIFGALPGLSGGIAIVLFLPFTFYLDPMVSISWLLGMYCGGTYGGSITAILIKTPGTAASAATVEDGYALAQQGKPGKALSMALVASVIGGIFSTFMLIFIAPLLSKMALKFGPAEYFSLAFFGLSIIAGVSGKSLFKGLIMGSLGMLISMIGMDPIAGVPRLTFNSLYLVGGIGLIPVLIGLFALPEILNKSTSDMKKVVLDNQVSTKNKEDKLTLAEFKASFKTIIQSSAIGTIIGAIPGTGAAIASFLSYNEAKRRSKNPDEYGRGSLDGIAASEAGNNGVTGATLIPLLTLGVPGDIVTAILVGAFLIHGLTPGPSLFKDNINIVYGIMISLLIINILVYLQGKYFVKMFANVNKIPLQVMLPLLFILCVIGVYVAQNSMFDVELILVFGVVAYFAQKFKFSITPMLLGVVLGPMAEQNFRKALVLSEGNYLTFITKPISLFFLILVALTFIMFIRKQSKDNEANVPAN
jgi:putative tricarboxylic transport membrane protein